MIDPLIQKILDGDKEAFRQIIQTYKDDAFSLAVSILKEETISRDAVQAAFVKAYSNLRSFKGHSSFSTWFYRIVYNESVTLLRKQSQVNEMLSGEDLADVSDEADRQELRLSTDHQRYYINAALRHLSANESFSLRLFFLLDHTIEEITQITGWSTSNTKVILHRARKKMEEILTSRYKIRKEELY